jgi:hypothetical protein
MKFIGLIWGAIIAAVVAFLVIPATNAIFTRVSTAAPYLLGYFKFMVLSSMGELLALRIRNRKWSWTRGFIPKALAWGIIGVLITFMFTFYSSAVMTLQNAGRLAGEPGGFLTALFTSVIMNLTFGPAFMIAHRISDTWIELLLARGGAATPVVRIGLRTVMESVSWRVFLRIVILSILAFWIPVHTLVFLLPAVYRVIAAALLSIALGVILAFANTKKERVADH